MSEEELSSDGFLSEEAERSGGGGAGGGGGSGAAGAVEQRKRRGDLEALLNGERGGGAGSTDDDHGVSGWEDGHSHLLVAVVVLLWEVGRFWGEREPKIVKGCSCRMCAHGKIISTKRA